MCLYKLLGLLSVLCACNSRNILSKIGEDYKMVQDYDPVDEKYVIFDQNAGKNFYCMNTKLIVFGIVGWSYTKEYKKRMNVRVGFICNQIDTPLFKFRNGTYTLVDRYHIESVFYLDKNRVIFYASHWKRFKHCSFYVQVGHVYHIKSKILLVDRRQDCPFEGDIRYPNANAISCDKKVYCDTKYMFYPSGNANYQITRKQNYFAGKQIIERNANWSCAVLTAPCFTFARINKKFPLVSSHEFVIVSFLIFVGSVVYIFIRSVGSLFKKQKPRRKVRPVKPSKNENKSSCVSMKTISTDLRSALSDISYTNSQIIMLHIPLFSANMINFEVTVNDLFFYVFDEATQDDLDKLEEWKCEKDIFNGISCITKYLKYGNCCTLSWYDGLVSTEIFIKKGSYISSIEKEIDSILLAYDYPFHLEEHEITDGDTFIDVSYASDQILYYSDYEKRIPYYLNEELYDNIEGGYDENCESNDFMEVINYEFRKDNVETLKTWVPSSIVYGEDVIFYSYTSEVLFKYIIKYWNEYPEPPFFECMVTIDANGAHIIHHSTLIVPDTYLRDWEFMKNLGYKKPVQKITE